MATLELELEGALVYGAGGDLSVRFRRMRLLWAARGVRGFSFAGARDGEMLSELVVAPPGGRELTLYETDFLEGLALQTAVAAENAIRVGGGGGGLRGGAGGCGDLDAARAIQQDLLPRSMPAIPGYSLAARSSACYEGGGRLYGCGGGGGWGSILILVADVAGKGLASALICTAFRSAFRALARQSLTLKELAARLSQQHWEEGEENRRRVCYGGFRAAGCSLRRAGGGECGA